MTNDRQCIACGGIFAPNEEIKEHNGDEYCAACYEEWVSDDE